MNKKQQNQERLRSNQQPIRWPSLCFRKMNGQVTLEFTFGVCMVVLVAVGMIRVFHWSSTDLAERRKAHENTMYNATTDNPEAQLREIFYSGDTIDATVDSNIFGP